MHPVGYVVHVRSPGRSGGETRSYQLAQALGACGVNVHLYGQLDSSFGWFTRVHPHQLKRPVPFGVLQLLTDFSRTKVGIVIERYQLPPFNPGFFVQQIRNKPLIFEVHGFPIEEFALFARQRDMNVSPMARLVACLPPVTWERLQRVMFQKTAHFIVTSIGTKDILAGMGIDQEKVSVIYNRVDPKLFDPNGRDRAACRVSLKLPLDRQLVLFAGTFTEELATLVEAASAVIKMHSSVLFVFVMNGSGTMLKALVEKHGISDRLFCLLPLVDHQQMPDLLAAVDVVLAPYSLQSERFRKGFHYSPLKILEALSMEKPVVTVDVEELRTVFGNLPGVRFVESGSAEGWAEGILHALNLSRNAGLAQGRAFVLDGYTWQDAAQKYLAILQAFEGSLP